MLLKNFACNWSIPFALFAKICNYWIYSICNSQLSVHFFKISCNDCITESTIICKSQVHRCFIWNIKILKFISPSKSCSEKPFQLNSLKNLLAYNFCQRISLFLGPGIFVAALERLLSWSFLPKFFPLTSFVLLSISVTFICLILAFVSTKVNFKYQGVKRMALFHLLLMFENPNDFEMWKLISKCIQTNGNIIYNHPEKYFDPLDIECLMNR